MSEKQFNVFPDATKDGQSMDPQWNRLEHRKIEGVKLHEVRPVITGYGRLVELFRSEWVSENPRVDQVFVSVLEPGAVSAWHMHMKTMDRLAPIVGTLRIVVFDGRAGSSTHEQIAEYRLGEHRPGMLAVPPGVWHGVQNMGSVPAILCNAVDKAYQYADPDHYRLPETNPHIPFQFARYSQT